MSYALGDYTHLWNAIWGNPQPFGMIRHWADALENSSCPHEGVVLIDLIKSGDCDIMAAALARGNWEIIDWLNKKFPHSIDDFETALITVDCDYAESSEIASEMVAKMKSEIERETI